MDVEIESLIFGIVHLSSKSSAYVYSKDNPKFQDPSGKVPLELEID